MKKKTQQQPQQPHKNLQFEKKFPIQFWIFWMLLLILIAIDTVLAEYTKVIVRMNWFCLFLMSLGYLQRGSKHSSELFESSLSILKVRNLLEALR